MIENLKGAYLKVVEEYENAFAYGIGGSNPPKTTIHAVPPRIDRGGLWMRRLTSMSARLFDGTCGTKVILMDENTGNMKSHTIVHKPNGQVKVVDSEELTRIRCGMMAAYAIEKFFVNKSLNRLTVVFIGDGRINRTTQEILNDMFGCSVFYYIDTRDEHCVTVIPDEVDVVISCTTACTEKETISFDAINAKLFIAQDSGYIFDKSFRENYESYCDYPEQILRHWHNEFPWDDSTVALHQLVNLDGSNDDFKAVVYLYGVAVADIALADFV